MIEAKWRPRKKTLSLFVPSFMIPGSRVQFMRDLWVDGLCVDELELLRKSIDQALDDAAQAMGKAA
jgi:hypothetical protein